MSTHTSSSADEVLTSAAESGPQDPLDALLGQIVGGYFVLTDGQGSVSKWSEPAELLFGRPAQVILGQSFFGTLLDPALTPEAQSWKSFLENGDPPSAAGRVSVKGMHAEGHQFPIEAVFVPVKLDEGFDFSLFLEDLGFELPLNLMLLRMRQQHPVVVRALGKAIEAEPQPWEGWRTAGTLVVFRPTDPTPWIAEALAAREAARAEQDADVEDRLTNHDPGVQGSSVRDLDDAAAVVARLLSAMERIDDLERMAQALPAQVQEARRDVDSSRARAEAAEREASRLRADLERALTEIKQGGNDRQHLELLARMDRLEHARLDEDAARASALKAAEASRAELAHRLERAEADRARAAEAIEGRVASAVAEAQQAELIAQLDRVRAEHEEAVQAARHELAATLEGIERDRERDAEAARAELRAALERVDLVQRESDALREQLTQMTVDRHEAEGLAGEERRRLSELQREVEETRARVDGLRQGADALRDEAKAAQQRVETRLAELVQVQAAPGADTADVAEVRSALEAGRVAQQELSGRLDALADAGHDVADIRRAQEELAERHADLLRAQDDFARRHEDVVQAQAEMGRRHDELAGAADELRAAQEALAALQAQVAAEQGEREQFRASTEHALAQLADVRAALQEHASSISVQLPTNAVEHEELAARVAELRGEIAAAAGQAKAEAAALQARLQHTEGVAERVAAVESAAAEATRKVDRVAEAGEAAQARLEQLAGAADGLATRVAGVEALTDGLVSREDLAAADARTAARIDEVAAEADAARRAAAEMVMAGQEIAARLDEAARAEDELAARVDEATTLARGAHEASTAARTEADELRGAVGRVAGELQVVRGELERARQEAAAPRREVETGRERLTTLGTTIERVTESATSAVHAAEAAQAEATAARRSGKDLAQLVGELDTKATTLRTEMGTGRERLQALDNSVDQLGQASMLAGKDAQAAKAAVEAQGTELRAEIAEVRQIAEKAQSGIDAILGEVALVRAQSERVVSDADTNRETVLSGERRLEAMAAEVTFALKSLEEIKAGLTSAGQAAVIARREAEQAKKAAQNAGEGSKDNVTEVFAQLLGLAAKKGNSGVHRRPSNPGSKKPGPSKREPRHGFDDAAQPMATLSLEGKFRELNPAFAKLVGYQEHEFGKATWPSPHDRSVYEQQQEQLSQLASGEIESVIVQSTYMHGQGLMVPVVGKITGVPGEDGLPLHLLLEAEDRHTS